jgi:hypothetical protein
MPESFINIFMVQPLLLTFFSWSETKTKSCERKKEKVSFSPTHHAVPQPKVELGPMTEP